MELLLENYNRMAAVSDELPGEDGSVVGKCVGCNTFADAKILHGAHAMQNFAGAKWHVRR